MLHLFLVIILLAFLERRKMLSEEIKQKVLQRINQIVKIIIYQLIFRIRLKKRMEFTNV